MKAYGLAVWRCRYFWLALVHMDLRSRYRGSVLGMGWSLLQPVAMTAIICLVFCGMFNQSLVEMAPYVMVGFACWNFMLASMLQGCQCFFLGEAYIRQYPAPMAIYPLRTILGAGFHFSLALGLGFFLALPNAGLHNLSALLALPIGLVLFMIAGWSLSVLAGLATVYFRDTRHLAEVGFQVVFYMTPILYPERLLYSHNLGWLLQCNPVVSFLKIIRGPLGAAGGDMGRFVPGPEVYAQALAFTLLLAVSAVYALTKLEKRLIFHL